MYEITRIDVLQQAESLCHRLGIPQNQNTVVLFLDDDTAHSNLEAVQNWIATQTDLIGLERTAVQTELYDRLVTYLQRRSGELVH